MTIQKQLRVPLQNYLFTMFSYIRKNSGYNATEWWKVDTYKNRELQRLSNGKPGETKTKTESQISQFYIPWLFIMYELWIAQGVDSCLLGRDGFLDLLNTLNGRGIQDVDNSTMGKFEFYCNDQSKSEFDIQRTRHPP